MLRTHLSDSQRSELQSLRRSDPPAVARTQLEVVFLSDAGWSAPMIARPAGHHPHTVRSAVKGYRDRGTAALYPGRPAPRPDHARRAVVTGQSSGLLAQDRTWTSQQLADALAPAVRIGRRQTRRYLAPLRAGDRRTARAVGHKRDPKRVERARTVLANSKRESRRVG